MTIIYQRPDLSEIARRPYGDPTWYAIAWAERELRDWQLAPFRDGHADALDAAAETGPTLAQMDRTAQELRELAKAAEVPDSVEATDAGIIAFRARGYAAAVDELHAALWELAHQGGGDGDE